MNCEPWVKLPNGKEFGEWGHEQEVSFNQRRRQRTKWEFYLDAFDFLTNNKIAGDYFEFGCHRARTFRMALSAARIHNCDAMKFLAFDSFKGLPTAEGIWQAGELITTERKFLRLVYDHGVYTDKVVTYSGFYRHSLTPGLAAAIHSKAAMITVDCDLYDSVECVLEFIPPFIQDGTLIYIDDWFCGLKGNPKRGAAGAFDDWTRRHTEWLFQPHQTIGWMGRSFIAYAAD